MTQTAQSNRVTFGRRDPDARGYFGAFGGRYVPETLVAPIEELTAGMTYDYPFQHNTNTAGTYFFRIFVNDITGTTDCECTSACDPLSCPSNCLNDDTGDATSCGLAP